MSFHCAVQAEKPPMPGKVLMLSLPTVLDGLLPGFAHAERKKASRSGPIVRGQRVGVRGASGLLVTSVTRGTGFHDNWASGINDSGQIVGVYSAARGHGFLLDQGSYTTLDVPGSWETYAFGFNASGQIVGWYLDGTGNTASFWIRQLHHSGRLLLRQEINRCIR